MEACLLILSNYNCISVKVENSFCNSFQAIHGKGLHEKITQSFQTNKIFFLAFIACKINVNKC